MALFDTQVTLSLTAFDKWILGGLGTSVLSCALFFLKLSWKAFTNCLPHIQSNTEETNQILKEMVGYFRAKAEDGKL